MPSKYVTESIITVIYPHIYPYVYKSINNLRYVFKNILNIKLCPFTKSNP